MGPDKPEVVLLDMGGVILRMAGGHGFPHSRLDWRGREALLHTLGKARKRISQDDLERLVFGPWHQQYQRREETGIEADWSPHLQRLRAATGSAVDDQELLAAWFRPYGEQLVPTAGAQQALTEIANLGLRLALVSNVPLPGTLYLGVLERYGLARFFESTCFSYDRGTRKPSPALLRLAMSELGAEPACAVMVGDRRERDITAGQIAGTRTVWIRSTDGGGPPADATVSGLSELPEVLRRWRR